MQATSTGWQARRSAVLLAAWLPLAAVMAAPAEPEPAAVPAGEWDAVRDETFDIVWATVNEAYFDPTFGGVDWAAVRDKYRVQLPQAQDKDALRGILMAMLGELRRTHFSIQPRELSVFTPAERSRMGTSGAELAFVEDRVAVESVAPGSAADRAGLRPGDVIHAVGGMELDRLAAYLATIDLTPARRGYYLVAMATSHLRGSVGTNVQLAVRGPDGSDRAVGLAIEDFAGEWSEPVGDFPSLPVVCRTAQGDDGLGYLHFNVFARQVMKDIRASLRAVPAGGGLVIDLRGNAGGLVVMAPGISGWLSDHRYSLGTMHLRQGHIGFAVAPQENAFLGPVALLIDCASASTSEIMAAGLQEAGRVRVFGETSPGAALPSLFKSLPTGDLLQYAIADLQTPKGVLIEGRGVIPDEPVRRTLADLAAGRDPVLDAARRWLEQARTPAVQP